MITEELKGTDEQGLERSGKANAGSALGSAR